MTFFLNRNNVFNGVSSVNTGPGFFTDLTVSGTTTTNNLIVQNSATIQDLEVTGDEVVDGNLSVLGNTVIGDTTISGQVSSHNGNPIFLNNPFYQRIRNFATYSLGGVTLTGAGGYIPIFGLPLVSGLLSGYNTSSGVFTPPYDGCYEVVASISNLIITQLATRPDNYNGPDSGFPIYAIGLEQDGVFNKGPLGGQMITTTTPIGGGYLGMNATYLGRLLPGTNTLRLIAGISRNPTGNDGLNTCTISITITYLG